MRRAWIPTLSLLVAVSGCSGGPRSSTPALSGQPQEAYAAGEFAVSGRAPETRTGVPAIVVLTPTERRAAAAPAAVAAMDQISRTFVPSILFVRTGRPAEFRNSDTELHNVNVKDAKSLEQVFNVAVATDEKYQYAFERDGVYAVSCDVHAGMSAHIVVASTPYVTLADQAGRFSFPGVAAGSYAVTVYAGARTIEETIEIRGPRSELEFR